MNLIWSRASDEFLLEFIHKVSVVYGYTQTRATTLHDKVPHPDRRHSDCLQILRYCKALLRFLTDTEPA